MAGISISKRENVEVVTQPTLHGQRVVLHLHATCACMVIFTQIQGDPANSKARLQHPHGWLLDASKYVRCEKV